MLWSIIEFATYLILFLAIIIMMMVKFNQDTKTKRTPIHEKKLDLLHKKFLLQNSRKKKKNQNNNQINNIINSTNQVQRLPSQGSNNNNMSRQHSRSSIEGGIGNFKTKDENVQNIDLQTIERLVKLNGDGFKQSQLTDFKLYLKIREKQLEEYQNIIMNRRFKDIKSIQHSKFQLTWYLVKLQIMRKNLLLNLLYEDRLGDYHSTGTFFVYLLEILISLTITQSIRRIFDFSWYSVDQNPDEREVQVIEIMICWLVQFFFTSPLFLLVQIWFDTISSEYYEVRKKILRLSPPRNCLCLIMNDQSSMNALVTAIIFILAVYQSICFHAELQSDHIDFQIYINWLFLCIADLVLFRNLYIFVYTTLKCVLKKDNVVKEELRVTALIYYLIDSSKKNKRNSQTASELRRQLIKQLNNKNQINNLNLFEDEEEKKSDEQDNELSQNSQNNQNSNKNSKKQINDKNKKQNNQKKSNNDESSDSDDFENELLEIEENSEKQKDKEDKKENDAQTNSQNQINQNNILQRSYVNKKTIKADSQLFEEIPNDSTNNQNINEDGIQVKEINQNIQIEQQLKNDIQDNYIEGEKNEKQLNTSFAYDEESVIQYEQPITIQTNQQQKIPKNKINQSYSRLLSINSFINQKSEIYSQNYGYKFISSVIKTFSSTDQIEDQKTDGDLINQNEKQTKSLNPSACQTIRNQKENNREQIYYNKNDSSFTINKEMTLGKINNLKTAQIMNLQEQKKFENDVSFLKNLNELQQLKHSLSENNKTQNDISIFGNKDQTQFINDDVLQNNHEIQNQNYNNNNNNLSYILNKSELQEIFKTNLQIPESQS